MKTEDKAKVRKRMGKKKVDALTCPYCYQSFTGRYYLLEHWCRIVETEYKHMLKK